MGKWILHWKIFREISRFVWSNALNLGPHPMFKHSTHKITIFFLYFHFQNWRKYLSPSICKIVNFYILFIFKIVKMLKYYLSLYTFKMLVWSMYFQLWFILVIIFSKSFYTFKIVLVPVILKRGHFSPLILFLISFFLS